MAEGEAFGELFRGAGIQFDPMVVAAFCAVVPGR
jgi:response regulator RpfG family c-di-GMP phosphodiesterase